MMVIQKTYMSSMDNKSDIVNTGNIGIIGNISNTVNIVITGNIGITGNMVLYVKSVLQVTWYYM